MNRLRFFIGTPHQLLENKCPLFFKGFGTAALR